ncbi:MAG: TetR/AcrR family transcriptional regulator [Clostridia bacterium]|nr:TetR/AcrR family transcriptional regulator [Clostridia bacterium]
MANLTRGKNFEAHKSKVLHIVARKFLEKGYHETTMKQIASESEMALGSLVNIFKNKEGILTELVAYVLECQYETVQKLLEGKTDDKIFLYAAETVLQLHMAESGEHMREMYSVSYTLPETSRVIYQSITKKLEYIFSQHLPTLETKDFYCLELAAGGITRSFMTVPCDVFFTMEMKTEKFLQALLRIYLVPEDKIAETAEFLKQFDFVSLAGETIDNMLSYLESKV